MEIEYDNKVIMISSDGQRFEISAKAAMRSQLMKDIIIGNTQEEIEVKANSVKGDILKKVVEYLEHYKNEKPRKIEQPFQSQNFKECVDEWDYDFIDKDLGIIFEIILASNYLNIQSLIELASAKIAFIIKGKTAEEIRNIFNNHHAFTPEEELQILKENKWFEENC